MDSKTNESKLKNLQDVVTNAQDKMKMSAVIIWVWARVWAGLFFTGDYQRGR